MATITSQRTWDFT